MAAVPLRRNTLIYYRIRWPSNDYFIQNARLKINVATILIYSKHPINSINLSKFLFIEAKGCIQYAWTNFHTPEIITARPHNSHWKLVQNCRLYSRYHLVGTYCVWTKKDGVFECMAGLGQQARPTQLGSILNNYCWAKGKCLLST